MPLKDSPAPIGTGRKSPSRAAAAHRPQDASQGAAAAAPQIRTQRGRKDETAKPAKTTKVSKVSKTSKTANADRPDRSKPSKRTAQAENAPAGKAPQGRSDAQAEGMAEKQAQAKIEGPSALKPQTRLVSFPDSPFLLSSPSGPAGDQVEAIDKLVEGLNDGMMGQTLLGVTGSGKTFTMANVIARTGRPAIVMAHNKTLAAQLYSEMRDFFPQNAVEYFVSHYDYYQPEAYIPSRDIFIDKDMSINDHIDQMWLSTTKSLITRKDVVIVASVSCIYGIGDPREYASLILQLRPGMKISRELLIAKLVSMQYTRNEIEFERCMFRVNGDVVDVYPAESPQHALRITLFDDEIERLDYFDPITGKTTQRIGLYSIFPASHFITGRENVKKGIDSIKKELEERLKFFERANEPVYALRLKERTNFDLEMLECTGHCKGMENYSRHFSDRGPGEPPPCLLNYLPDNAIMFIDESHATLPQIGGMQRGDAARKKNLIDYGFRLPSAADNRPLKFDEFERLMPQTIFVSATPAEYELERSGQIVEQVVRPTGLLDPEIEIRPVENQVDDLVAEIRGRTAQNERVLVTTLTKKMAEKLTEYLDELGVKVRYLHSDVDTVERVQIIQDLRIGTIEALVGINLLREGLDIPEVSLVAILDADKEGFLRSERSLIQTIGRAARNVKGKAILYADKETDAIKGAVAETLRRREKQSRFNAERGVTPKQIVKEIKDIIDGVFYDEDAGKKKKGKGRTASNADKEWEATLKRIRSEEDAMAEMKKLDAQMRKRARELNYEDAARLRDQIEFIKTRFLFGL